MKVEEIPCHSAIRHLDGSELEVCTIFVNINKDDLLVVVYQS